LPNVKYNAPANGEAPFSWLLKNTQYKVAGKKLIELYESKKEGEDVTPVEIMKIGQDVGLGLDGMSEVMKLVDSSGALRSNQIKRTYEAGQTAANTGLTESTKSEAYPAGLPADVAGAVIKEKAKPSTKSLQNYGTTPDGKPVSYSPTDGKYYIPGDAGPVEYTGEVKKSKDNPDPYDDFAAGYSQELIKKDPTLVNNPSRLKMLVSDEWQRRAAERQANNVRIRVEGQGDYRMKDYYDIATRSYITMSATDFNNLSDDDKKNRYMPATKATSIINQRNLIADMKGVSQDTRYALEKLVKPFDAKQIAQISYILKSTDPQSAWGKFTQSMIGKTLTPDQIEYVTSLLQLQENAMAMRSVLGAGQGSDELREAIKKTIPGAATPNKQFALTQLDKFDKTLDRLTTYTPSLDYKPRGSKTDLYKKYGLER
jgi:hypothetical protein